jgi:flagellar basal-body rod modification protein FlgD
MTAPLVAMRNASAHATPLADPPAGNGNSNGQSSSITSNDFLTLLVTEMKNQDPTAQTDPNEYINQLVQVNSLQQLIEINGSLSSALGTSNGTAVASGEKTGIAHRPGGNVSSLQGGNSLPGGSRLPAVANSELRRGTVGTGEATAFRTNPLRTVSGNLGVPVPLAAAGRVAHALTGDK